MAWQCLIRQHAMRRENGRPSSAMTPRVVLANGSAPRHIRTVLLEQEPVSSGALFRQTVSSTHDPRERFEKGLKHLAATYFQTSREFEPRLFAQFSRHSTDADALVAAGSATLHFEQFSQSWILPCGVQDLACDDPFATVLFWHNALFAPPPASPRALAFLPDWHAATANPPVQPVILDGTKPKFQGRSGASI